MFAIVDKNGLEIMYQTCASVISDDPKSASGLTGRSAGLVIRPRPLRT